MSKVNRKLFVSYSRLDSQRVKPLVRLLRASAIDVFIDVENIDYGESWEVVINEQIKSAERILIFWSINAAKSDEVRREYLLALQIAHVKIIPITLDSTPLPPELSQFQALTELKPLLTKPES